MALPLKNDRLTKREMEIARHLAHGLTKPEIAEKLTIELGTVKAHCINIQRTWQLRTARTDVLQAEAKQRGYNTEQA